MDEVPMRNLAVTTFKVQPTSDSEMGLDMVEDERRVWING